MQVAEASQAGMMWNLQWSPDIPGAFAPVSRGWGRPWVIFDWDNIFGAYQLSLGSKELGYSQVRAGGGRHVLPITRPLLQSKLLSKLTRRVHLIQTNKQSKEL
jgi:hypothetical protein